MVEFKQSLDLKCNFGVMHKLMGAYTYIYGKAVELLQYSVEKAKIAFSTKISARFCAQYSAPFMRYTKTGYN